MVPGARLVPIQALGMTGAGITEWYAVHGWFLSGLGSDRMRVLLSGSGARLVPIQALGVTGAGITEWYAVHGWFLSGPG